MKKRYIRLDDACPKIDSEKWDKMEALLKKYEIKPLVGLIPDCQDPDMGKYPEESDFWSVRVQRWKKMGWIFALHGYQHVFRTSNSGVNPVNNRSEFAGLPIEVQRQMIREGLRILEGHKVKPSVFFAPAHTYDSVTIEALREESDIRIISDTPANDTYKINEFTFIPQQSGKVRNLPFKTITYCYHPNNMIEKDYEELEWFINKYKLSSFSVDYTNRELSIYDKLLMALYYKSHRH